jgi:hypothetical protein
MYKKALWQLASVIYSLFYGLSGFSQNLTKSPYSIIGFGEMHFYGTATLSALGQVSQGLRQQNEINVLNPASFSALKYTVIDGGVLYSRGTLTKGNEQQTVSNYSFSYFLFGVPLSQRKNAGFVFGLSPYSSIGYNVSSNKTYTDFTGVTQMTGSGGLSRFHAGIGAQLIKNVSVGVNANYLFGQSVLDQRLIIPSEYNKVNIADTRRRNINDFQYQLGLQYHKEIVRGEQNEKHQLVVGASYTFGASLSGLEDQWIRSFKVETPQLLGDTITYVERARGTVFIPGYVQTGISYEKKDHWIIAADFTYQNWSLYQEFGNQLDLNAQYGSSVGFIYIPNSSDYKKYFKRVEYRGGLRYNTGYFTIANKAISTYGVSAGLGLPLGKSKSRINISGEYFIRGTTSNNLIREEYFRIVFGINFTDKWFQRYKYD